LLDRLLALLILQQQPLLDGRLGDRSALDDGCGLRPRLSTLHRLLLRSRALRIGGGTRRRLLGPDREGRVRIGRRKERLLCAGGHHQAENKTEHCADTERRFGSHGPDGELHLTRLLNLVWHRLDGT
jgi:hypothetical protein